MATSDTKTINRFKKSQDYKDICYMVDHVVREDVRLSCIESLNYKVGLNILMPNNDPGIKGIILGKDGEIRMQITPKRGFIAACAIVDFKNSKTNN